MEMLDYPAFLENGYEIGSGPTKAFCKTLMAGLKGSGMRWDKPHGEGIMALAAIRSSGLWNQLLGRSTPKRRIAARKGSQTPATGLLR